MNELPDLVLCKLFDQLDLKDRLRCRQVSKRFLLLIDSLPSKELAIDGQDCLPCLWYDDFRAINRRNSIHLSTGSKLFHLNLLGSRYFGNLKKLHFDLSYKYIFEDNIFEGGKPLEFSLSFLNSFVQLKTLLIKLPAPEPYFRYDCKEPVVLRTLVNLYFSMSVPDEDLLQLVCENLNYFELEERYWSPLSERVQLTHPEQIRHVRTSSGCFEDNIEFLKQFKCVRELDCRMDDLSGIPNLIELITDYKELQILSIQAINRSYKKAEIEQLKEQLITTWPNLEVYLNGLHIKLFDKLKCFHQDSVLGSNLDFYLQQHRSTSKLLRQFYSLDYDHWESFEPRIPSGFLQKLVNLSIIKVNGRVNNPNCLANLLCKCNLITMLNLTNSLLGQTFYSNLGHYAPYLTSLEIQDDLALVESLNFNFLFEFSDLCFFKVNRALDLNLAYRLFMGSFSTQMFEFLIEGRPSYLVRMGSDSDCRSDPKLVDNENLKAWTCNLAKEYNRKYEDPLKVIRSFELPIQFVFFYTDLDR